ncbi:MULTISPECIES: phosphatidylglycerophosphatase A family protein [Alkalihalophilus]|uniref:Phosphatidylglycerophosphatase n=2 Tax=Alkalihalophilus pseudofirmus TaxID=79885 RepID=D3FYL6_ALKPO|nr:MULTISPECIES: phosphatidylglycerophosphatase A [Alkalihalophilus]ADC50868.1 phosphatidylglycerophosphatase [Alkalihalophilus pseudofirmus OF4]MDV2884064.1 phosphatidylglycerophosphatase A [Alkalihalophilus pseudofirmus]MEC2070554.1 phosphatidylglycerophosphatase A [Alkalihalophilus marmarensis]MED1601242.1 phosphatidylglycerophosphatase A [Alkalihalophilus marmarensis]OLS34115.1 phosphatidylglycerophosphatase A [Alkalihalophilus pseudofirmus]
MKTPVHCEVVEQAAREKLKNRGVSIDDIASIVYDLQRPYNAHVTHEQCYESVDAVLCKREIQHAILVGIELDELAEKKQLSEPLQSLIDTDEGLFGVDETIALGSVFGFGSIAVTSFGYLDKQKVGIINELDKRKSEVHTFLDDLVASIAASAAARLAHRLRDIEENRRLEDIKKREDEELIG